MGPGTEIGACLGTLYDNIFEQKQSRIFVDHMHQVGIHNLHVYTKYREIAFDSHGLAWYDDPPSQPLLHMQGVEWIYVDVLPINVR